MLSLDRQVVQDAMAACDRALAVLGTMLPQQLADLQVGLQLEVTARHWPATVNNILPAQTEVALQQWWLSSRSVHQLQLGKLVQPPWMPDLHWFPARKWEEMLGALRSALWSCLPIACELPSDR